MLMLEKIKKNVERAPERKVIISGEYSLTYGQLWEKSQALAAWLEDTLGDNREPVVVYGHKNPYMLVCFTACVRTGRAYCPVDISMPAERIADIVGTVDNKIVLATEDTHELEGYRVINLEEIDKITSDPQWIEKGMDLSQDLWAKDEDTYYIIFTSGSTGKPKGVEISHGALSRFTDWSKDLAFDAADKDGCIFLNQAPFSFDLSVMDVYTSLACGSTIFCLTKAMQKDMATMLEKIKESGIKYWVSTPSFADMCLADRSFYQELAPELRAFLFCGEKLNKDTAEKLMDRFEKAKVINTYGPTESTVAITSIEITREMIADEERELPIGVVKPGTEVRVLPNNHELIILGDTLSKGYFKNEEKTKEAFFATEDGKRAYHTGDEGHFEGNVLYYRGRIDLQIKLHGYRIELGDIEANLMSIGGVSGAAVVPKRQNGKIRHLVAFVVKEGSQGSFEESKAIKGELKKKLPEYMVPKKINFVDQLPMTPNGKTDRKKLEASL